VTATAVVTGAAIATDLATGKIVAGAVAGAAVTEAAVTEADLGAGPEADTGADSEAVESGTEPE